MTNKLNQFTIHNSLLTNFAFTLAETLIVMGIIGVVAALTLPNLNSSTGDKEKVTKVKKIYSNLEDAIGRAQAVYGPVDEWFKNDTTATAQATRFGERISEFLKLSKNCGTATGCFTSGNYKWFDGTASNGNYNSNNTFYKVILADGTSLNIDATNKSNLKITMDIDGANKGPYTLGKDLFILDFSVDNATFYRVGSTDIAECIDFGTYCIQWILKNDNMDYLKVDSSGKCPNGTVLSDTNNSCK